MRRKLVFAAGTKREGIGRSIASNTSDGGLASESLMDRATALTAWIGVRGLVRSKNGELAFSPATHSAPPSSDGADAPRHGHLLELP